MDRRKAVLGMVGKDGRVSDDHTSTDEARRLISLVAAHMGQGMDDHPLTRAEEYARVASLLGVSPRTVSNWPTNKNDSVDRRMPAMVRTLCRLLLGEVDARTLYTVAMEKLDTGRNNDG